MIYRSERSQDFKLTQFSGLFSNENMAQVIQAPWDTSVFHLAEGDVRKETPRGIHLFLGTAGPRGMELSGAAVVEVQELAPLSESHETFWYPVKGGWDSVCSNDAEWVGHFSWQQGFQS